jgi:queuine tRNA-ribosyltransferase
MNYEKSISFEVEASFEFSRASILSLKHGKCNTPMFMPVGTQAAIKGITPGQMKYLGVDLMLCNTYFMNLRPGPDIVSDVGGLHNLMNWDGCILTDSGGFQMVSLLSLSEVTEEGVRFKSPVDGQMTLLTPEESIKIQNKLGADIIMALDDVVPSTMSGLDCHSFYFVSFRTTSC